jgi:RNA polymerase sigma-70 factor, ECF subfamily
LSPENQKKFEQLFKELFAPLCGFSMKYIYDLDDAKNIVHEVFMSVWEKFENLSEGTSHKSYLYTAVKNKSLNFIRDKKKHVILEDVDDQEPMEENLSLETAELEKEIEIALQSLPEKCREVFELNRQEGLKYAEIAQKLNISIKTVEAQMSKALAIMREHLKDFMILLIFLLLE